MLKFIIVENVLIILLRARNILSQVWEPSIHGTKLVPALPSLRHKIHIKRVYALISIHMKALVVIKFSLRVKHGRFKIH